MKLSNIERNFAEALNHELNVRGRGSRKFLAEEMGIPQSTLSGWVKGARGTKEEERRKISGILGMDYETMINQTATAKHSSVVSQVSGHGNTISVMQKSDLTAREQELIAALRAWGNDKMIDSMLAKIDNVKKMSEF